MEKKKYKIVKDYNYPNFLKEVNNLMDEGYIPTGGVTYSNGNYIQKFLKD